MRPFDRQALPDARARLQQVWLYRRAVSKYRRHRRPLTLYIFQSGGVVRVLRPTLAAIPVGRASDFASNTLWDRTTTTHRESGLRPRTPPPTLTSDGCAGFL